MTLPAVRGHLFPAPNAGASGRLGGVWTRSARAAEMMRPPIPERMASGACAVLAKPAPSGPAPARRVGATRTRRAANPLDLQAALPTCEAACRSRRARGTCGRLLLLPCDTPAPVPGRHRRFAETRARACLPPARRPAPGPDAPCGCRAPEPKTAADMMKLSSATRISAGACAAARTSRATTRRRVRQVRAAAGTGTIPPRTPDSRAGSGASPIRWMAARVRQNLVVRCLQKRSSFGPGSPCAHLQGQWSPARSRATADQPRAGRRQGHWPAACARG